MVSSYWAKTYGRESEKKYTCPECGQTVGSVTGDTHIGTRYDNGGWDSRTWLVLKCGHGIEIFDWVDGPSETVPAPQLVTVS